MNRDEYLKLSDSEKRLYLHGRILELDSVTLLRSMLIDLNLNQGREDYLFLNYFEE